MKNDEAHIDAFHNSVPLRYRTMADILGDQLVLGFVPHDLEAELLHQHEGTSGMACRNEGGDGCG
jgi:hypothetical protein